MAMRALSASMRIVALAVVLLSALSHANLMGVDLGLSYIKVAVARPGKGLELVTNEQAKRKTPAAVGFTIEGERLFGDAAIAYAAKAPHRAIINGRSLIGMCADADTGSNPHGSPLCARHQLKMEGLADFTGEEVVAMQLAMAKRQASAFLGGAAIKDVAITVPAWYDERQRLAVADAARIIGLNCLGVVNANTAAAIKYALDGKAKPTEATIEAEKAKDKKKRAPKTVSQRVMFFDMGAGSASASIAVISSDVKTGIANSIKMLSHASEKGLGGRLFDTVIIDRLADAFDKQRGASATPSRDLPRVMTRLTKEAQKVREVLSANLETFVSVGSLHDDIDLRTTVSRADFESDAKSMLSLVSVPVKAALIEAKLSATDLDAVVPFGGASRTPLFQDQLLGALGVPTLNKSINTDEAAVMGSVFFAASLSSTFRVRKMDVDDIYERGVSVEIDRDGGSGGLFSGSKKGFQTVDVFADGGVKMPSKKTLSLNRKDDFSMRVFLNVDKSGKSRFPERTLYAKILVKGVSEVLSKLKDQTKAKSTTPRVAISVHVDRSGLIRIGTAESSVDETVVVEREVEIKEDKKDKKPSKDDKDKKEEPVVDKETPSPSSEEKKEGDEGEKTEDVEEDKTNDSESKDKKKPKKEKKTRIEKSTQTIVHRHTLTVNAVEGEGILGMQMSGKELEHAQKVLKDLEKADNERVERADALNALEGYILEVRSKVRGAEEDDDMYKVTIETEREELVNAFDEAEDWMYTDEAKQTANLRKKHFDLRKLYSPMEMRAKQLSLRPEVIKQFREAITKAMEAMSSIQEEHIAAKSTHVEELAKFPKFCQELQAWMDEKEMAQAGKALTEAPAFTSDDVVKKVKGLAKEVMRLNRLEIPVVTKVESGTNTEAGDDTKNTTDSEEGKGDDGKTAEGDMPPQPDADSAQADAGSTTKEEL